MNAQNGATDLQDNTDQAKTCFIRADPRKSVANWVSDVLGLAVPLDRAVRLVHVIDVLIRVRARRVTC